MKALIMHGSYGSPDSNWFRWLERELKKREYDVILKQFPSDDWETTSVLSETDRLRFSPVQSLNSWTRFFQEEILPEIKNEPFIFIGHSIAPIFFIRMVEKFSLQTSLALFVAPFFYLAPDKKYWQFWPVNKTFYGSDFDFEKLNKLISLSYAIYGDNDPYVPITQPLEFASKLGSNTIAVKNGGHLGGVFTEFPLLLELIEKK